VRVLCCSCSRAFLKIEEVFQVLGQRSPPPGSAAIDLGAPLTKPYKSTLCASSCSQCVHTACSASTDIHVSLQLADFSAGHPFCAMTRTVLRLCRRCARRLDGLPRAPGLPGAGGRPRRPGPGSGGAEQRCELSLHHYYSLPVSKYSSEQATSLVFKLIQVHDRCRLKHQGPLSAINEVFLWGVQVHIRSMSQAAGAALEEQLRQHGGRAHILCSDVNCHPNDAAKAMPLISHLVETKSPRGGYHALRRGHYTFCTPYQYSKTAFLPRRRCGRCCGTCCRAPGWC